MFTARYGLCLCMQLRLKCLTVRKSSSDLAFDAVTKADNHCSKLSAIKQSCRLATKGAWHVAARRASREVCCDYELGSRHSAKRVKFSMPRVTWRDVTILNANGRTDGHLQKLNAALLWVEKFK